MNGRAHRLASAAALAGAALVLSGCSTPAAPASPPAAGYTGSSRNTPAARASPTSDPTATPTWSPQEQKAADAAIAAFKEYLHVSDAVMRNGGKHPERLKDVATGIVLAADENDARSFRNAHQHVVGHSAFDHLRVKNVSLRRDQSPAHSHVVLHTCVDVSQTKVKDSDGTTVKQSHRRLRWPSTYTIAHKRAEDAWLIRDLKQGSGKC